MPTHRRRGILARPHAARSSRTSTSWGEPIAALWASEAAIYGRFGYGHRGAGRAREVRPRALRARDDEAPQARSGSSTPTRRTRSSRRSTSACASARPGMLTRIERWWKEHRLADPEELAARREPEVLRRSRARRRRSRATRRTASRSEWEDGLPKGEVRVIEAFATSPAGRAGALALPARDRPDDPGRRCTSIRLAAPPAGPRPSRARPAARRRALAAPRRPRRRAEGPLVPSRASRSCSR